MIKNCRVLDLFSGMGGFSYGFKKAGYSIDQGYDNWQVAIDSYEKNIKSPATKINLADFFPCKKSYEVIVVGGSPCQDFSILNVKRNIFSKRSQLVLDFCRIVQAVKPEVFVFENVVHLPNWCESALFELKGYKITKNIINAKYFGIPQNRKRKIFIGSKKKTISIKNPIINTVKTVREVFSKITKNWGFTNHKPNTIKKFAEVKSNSWISKSKVSNYQGIIRLNWNDVACAITNIKKAQILHPSENRVISIAEALALQEFPEWFIPEGCNCDKAIQVSNAIPPTLAENIGKIISKRLN